MSNRVVTAASKSPYMTSLCCFAWERRGRQGWRWLLLAAAILVAGIRSPSPAVGFESTESGVSGAVVAFATMHEFQQALVSPGAVQVRILGFNRPGDGGEGAYSRLTNVTEAKPWQVRSRDGAVWQLQSDVARPQQFGAQARSSADDSDAFQNAIDFAQSTHARVHIPAGHYTLSRTITNKIPIDISSDASATLTWNKPVPVGIDLDYRNKTSRYGLSRIQLPQLYSPTIVGFRYPGYPKGWDPGARIGTGVLFRGGSRVDLSVQYLLGWSEAVRLSGTADAMGATAVENLNVNINTIDLCGRGIVLDGGEKGSRGIAAVDVEVNTLSAKIPVFYDGRFAAISATKVSVNGQVFVIEEGGAAVYGSGVNIFNNSVYFNWVFAGLSPVSSPTATPAEMTRPYLAGDAASNGLTTDGNSDVGYFAGSNNDFSFGVATQLKHFPGGRTPTAGAITRIRDAGVNNTKHINFFSASRNTPVQLSNTRGEGNFGGGIGAAGITRDIYVKADLPMLSPGAGVDFYFYHTWLSSKDKKTISATIATPAVSNFAAVASDMANQANREGMLRIINRGQTNSPSQSIVVRLSIEN